MSAAIKLEGTHVAPPTNVVPVNERDAALEFAAVVIPFSVGDLARSAKRTKEAAKRWKAGRALPSGWSLFNMAQDIKPVRDWMLSKLGAAERNGPQAVSMAVLAFQTLVSMPGPDGDAVRAALANVLEKKNG